MCIDVPYTYTQIEVFNSPDFVSLEFENKSFVNRQQLRIVSTLRVGILVLDIISSGTNHFDFFF